VESKTIQAIKEHHAKPSRSSPVDLVQVDVVCLQPPEAGIAGCQNLLASEVGLWGSLVVKRRVGPAVQSEEYVIVVIIIMS
jgi:hypothetical protein